jgi:hypothetical protein
VLVFKNVEIEFPSRDDTDKQRITPPPVQFKGKVHGAAVAIQGFRLAYDNGDHHVKLERVGIENVKWIDQVVSFEAFIGLQDADKNFYSGHLTAVVIADVA